MIIYTHKTIVAILLAVLVLAGTTDVRADGSDSAGAVNNAPALPATYEKLKELPPGNHKLLETMTKNFGLTYDQQLEIEPLLHDEESVSKPILGFAAFTPAEKQAMLLMIKHAARRQIRPFLTPEQQIKADKEDAGLAAKSGGKGAGKKAPAASTEESVMNAIRQYAALTPMEKETMMAKVKEAGQRPTGVQPEAATQP